MIWTAHSTALRRGSHRPSSAVGSVPYFSLASGQLDGDFNTQEIMPTPEGPYFGTVEFDRDEWEVGADVFILNGLYTRVAYSGYQMEGDWMYFGGGPIEPQRYRFDALGVGLGFIPEFHPIEHIQGMLSGEPVDTSDSRVALVVDAFVGVDYFVYEHTERDTSQSVDTDGIGYAASLEAIVEYQLGKGGDSRIFVGGGYGYRRNDASDLDLTNQGWTAKLGVEIGL